MLDNTPIQPSKFRTENWVEINDDSQETYNTNSQLNLKLQCQSQNSCGYSDAYILIKGTITFIGKGVNSAATQADRNIKHIIF